MKANYSFGAVTFTFHTLTRVFINTHFAFLHIVMKMFSQLSRDETSKAGYAPCDES